MHKFVRTFVLTFLAFFTVAQAHAAVIFALRGDSLAPRYALGGKSYSPYVAAVNLGTLPAVITAASISATGTRGSSLLDVHITNGDERALKYRTGANWVTGTNVFSARISFVPNWTGNPATDRTLLLIGNDPNNYHGGLRVQIFDNGKLNVSMMAGDSAGTALGGGTTASALSFTALAKTEIMVKCDGTTIYASQNGVEVGSWPLTTTTRYMNNVLAGHIYLGRYPIDTYIDELVIWNTAEAHVYSPAASYESVADFDGTSSSDPGIANVRSATAYTINGSSLTGTAAIPAASDVKTGVSVGSTTGSYTGADRWTCPTAGQLSNGVALKCNSTTTNLTGTLDSVTNVLISQTMTGSSTSGVLVAQ